MEARCCQRPSSPNYCGRAGCQGAPWSSHCPTRMSRNGWEASCSLKIETSQAEMNLKLRLPGLLSTPSEWKTSLMGQGRLELGPGEARKVWEIAWKDAGTFSAGRAPESQVAPSKGNCICLVCHMLMCSHEICGCGGGFPEAGTARGL